jgi:hypothetical protein
MTNMRPTSKPIIAPLPNGKRVHSMHTCTLYIPAIPASARHAHIIPGLASQSLISVVTLCNAGCNVVFAKIGCTITYCGKVILCGSKCTCTELWMIPLYPTPPSTANNNQANTLPTVIAANMDTTSSTGEYARYIHQALCSPPTTTLIQALKCSRELATIPGLTAHLINPHLPYSTATDKGHMRRHRQGIQSTQTMQPAIVQARHDVNSLQPDEEICATHDMFCFAALADLNTGTMYTGLPGAFPVRSFKSMQYIFVVYIYERHTCACYAFQEHAAMITAFIKILATLAARGYKPTLNVTDNKCSKTVEAYIKSNKMDIHLVLPHNHQVNAAKCAIATFKEHFIAGLATVDRNRPLQLWDEFLHQVKLTLNLLRFSCRDSRKSAHKEVHGPYDFNKTPITPIGTKGLVYNDPAV